MEVVGINLLLILAFVLLGLVGWVLKAFGWVFEFLKEGFFTSLGCLFWVFLIILLIMGMVV